MQSGLGSDPVQVRAADDSANIGGTTVTPRRSPWRAHARSTAQSVPATTAADDPGPVELGLTFSPSIDGYVTGVRFYKGAGNSGHPRRLAVEHRGCAPGDGDVHGGVGDAGGRRRCSRHAVAVAAGTSYVVSYTAPAGHYAVAVRTRSGTQGVGRPHRCRSRAGSARRGRGRTAARDVPGAELPVERSTTSTSLFSTVDTTPLTITSPSPLGRFDERARRVDREHGAVEALQGGHRRSSP